MVLGHVTSFQYALFPVLVNVLLLVAVGAVYNNLTGRRYPHAMVSATAAQAPGAQPQSRFSAADLDAAMAHYNQVLDVDRSDLTELLHQAELAAYERNLGTLRCADIMSTRPISADFAMPLDEAWTLMRERGIKALPVVDKAQHIVGIVTLADFMRQAGLDAREGIGKRLRALVQRDGGEQSDKPEVVGQIMTRKVRVAGQYGLVIDLVPLFSEGGHHHIPIIDDDKHLVGIITQSDLVSALYRVVRRPD
jgi:CBS domain-containing membrane protein